jgi:hypothetical protein
LWQGEGWKVIAEAQAAGLSANYFADHRYRMDYPAYRADGYPVGSVRPKAASSNTSSAFVGLACAGHVRNVDPMIVLPSAAMAGRFDQDGQQPNPAPKVECTPCSKNLRN